MLAIFALLLGLNVSPARAKVIRLKIDKRVPFAEGHSFGQSGPYEKISGRMIVEVDPDDPANARINDLKLAPHNKRGKVECWTDFCLLKPVDPRRGNRRILYDVHNRGNKLAVWTFNEGEFSNTPSTMADAGNGFLMRQGYSVLWTGWNGDVMDEGNSQLLLGAPVARKKDGGTITGKAHVEICVDDEGIFSKPFFGTPWGTSDAYPAASLDNSTATLTMRPRRSAEAVEVPRDRWAFAKLKNGKPTPDAKNLYVKDGFRPGWLYDLVYPAKNPRVTGLGFASLRDCVSFFRHADEDDVGTPNPLAGYVERAYIFGISQSGRVTHHFVYDGFNTDEAGNIVFDGVLAHIAGSGKGMFNYRFQMTTVCGSSHKMHLSGSEFFPLAPMPQTDPLTGRQGDSLAIARVKGHTPKMMFTQTSTEYWNRAASLLHTDVEGKRDLKLPPYVRIYLMSGAQHLGGGENTPGICQQPRNTLKHRGPLLRALLVALDRWVCGEIEPPTSRYPRIDDGTLVDLKSFRKSFPKIPGVNLPNYYWRPYRLDFGPRFHTQGIADIVPPKMGPQFNTLVPAVDADGNEIAGIRLPGVAVPLGTYTGWNLRDPKHGAGEMLHWLDGMYLPFARTHEQQIERHDPRPSVLDRYPTRENYLAHMAETSLQLYKDGLLLPEDVITILQTAAQRNFWGKQ